MLNTQRIKIIGLGGIGSILSDNLCRYLNYRKISVDVILIDGDDYELKNQERQSFVKLGSKSRVKCTELRLKFNSIYFDDCNEYVSFDNIGDIIKENDIVFVCVDNHKTRKLIANHIKTLDNIIVISGGNETTNGNVQICIKKGGEYSTANLDEYHPEIDNPDDKSPEEMSCEELANVEPQLLFTNMTVATIMCWIYYSIDKGIFNPQKIGEVYFDMLTMGTLAHQRIHRV